MGSLLSLHLFLLLLTHFTSKSFSLCNPHDSSALLQFKNSFSVNTSSKPDVYSGCSSFSFKTESWKNNTDCCKWDGVTCSNVSNHVIGLDLSCNNLQGELHPNITLFKLRHLQQLNLAFNNFSMSSLHVGVGDLVNLTYLNLTYCNLSGNIPSQISHLSKLVSLDLSNGFVSSMKLNPFTWKKLILNATNLRELNLDGVNMSSIEGSSLSMLKNLSSSLVSLSLYNTGLQGNLSSDILSLPNLQKLDLSFNEDLSGQLPKSNWSTPLRYLDLTYTAFSGEIPYSIGQLMSLTHLELTRCNFNGMVPQSLWNLTQLTYLNLAGNNFEGEIPSLLSKLTNLTLLHLGVNKFSGNIQNVFENLFKLEYLLLSDNKLVGPIPSEIPNHSKLKYLSLSGNMLNGTIPHWCYYLPSLLRLDLNDNNLTGFIDEFSTHSLESLSLSNNNLHGHFPNSIFELQNLSYIDLSSTNLSGVVHFHQFLTFKNLYFLNLSHNSALSINIDSKAKTLPPHFQYLSSTNSDRFPKFLAPLPVLDLSNNNIHGKISKWFQSHLLSLWKNIEHIDLSFNKLQGDIPIPPYASSLRVLNLAHNNFTGDIALSLCNASSLRVLNLAHNNLTGKIPQCLGTFPYLSILDMQMNKLYGSIPRNFSEGNYFETIKLNGNQLEGPLPRSLASCTNLEILDLGNNNIEDEFPNWLETLQELQVLSLRSNKLHGTITCSSFDHPFPKLRIFDISHNKFGGTLPTSCIKNFQGMMNASDNQASLKYIGNFNYYTDSVVVVLKGLFMELKRISTIFTIIDFSNNMFVGEIPHDIGELISLRGLNLSNNEFTGKIPQSLSNLRNLEGLDLSRNQLIGEIPTTLTKLNFLSFLNLSQNRLEGVIPKGQQFDTFGNDSYEGNTMLCGLPLSKSCKNDENEPPISTPEDKEESGFGWKAVVAGYVCGAILGLLLGFNVFFFEKPQWLVRFFEHMFNVRLKRTRNKRGGIRRRMN